jgi:hypothetical protein
MPKGWIRSSLVAGVMALIASAAVAGQARAEYDAVPTPDVTGPIAVTQDPESYPFLSTEIDLSRYGYVEQEFFISGNAYRYDLSGDLGEDGIRIETGGPNGNGTYPFQTRIVVRRPADPADANGTVVAEWNNVTATRDIEWNWLGDPEFMLRNGYTFVGVTAQNVGLLGLRSFDSDRYGDVEGRWDTSMAINPLGPNDPALDDLSYDIYGAALKAIRGAGTGEDPLGGIDAETLIASGESQSCGRLAAHYNYVQPLQEIADAYLLTVCGSQLRVDRPEKVIRILTETENRTERSSDTFPDTDAIRHWEVAGTSHLPRLAWDNVANLLNRDFLPLTVDCTKFPLSLVKWPFTANRAIAGLETWATGGAAPPIAPRGVYTEGALLRNQYGIAEGGIRYPDLTVPTAVNDGVNSPAPGGSLFSGFCGLLGSSTPFEQTTLRTLYTDHADYVRKYSREADRFLGTGFILAQDVPRLKRTARQFPRLRPSQPRLAGLTGKGKRPRLVWTASEAPDTTFLIERTRVRPGKKARWTKVRARVTRKNAAFSNARVVLNRQPRGIWRYRVRSQSVIPANNIAPAETVTTPFSKASRNVRIRR